MYRSRYGKSKRRRRRAPAPSGGAVTLTKERRSVGRKRVRSNYNLFKTILDGGSKRVLRWQQLSENILGPGKVFLGWCDQANGSQRVPVHCMSLTNHTFGQSNVAKGCHTNGVFWLNYGPGGDNFWARPIVSQDFTGANSASGAWQVEFADHTVSQPARRIHHSWTDIRLNLYGCYTVPITYDIWVMTVPEQLDPFSNLQDGIGWPAAKGTELWNMYKDIVRQKCGNVIAQNGRSEWTKDVRFIKRYVRTIQPLSYSDQLAEGQLTGNSAAVGNVHKMKIFLKHDRLRDYKWSENAEQTSYDNTLVGPGWDVNQPFNPMSDCEWGKKLFLFITATSPTPESGTIPDNDFVTSAEVSNRQGSYDIMVRNCFHVFSA